MFAGNPDVMFADINLSERDSSVIRGSPHNPGEGGWPTIRYFNKETGYAGGAYIKKTDKSMCDELGTLKAMTDYVADYGGTSNCDISSNNKKGCSQRERAYIEKIKHKSVEEQSQQLSRLEGMMTKPMAPDLLTWVKRRRRILKQFIQSTNNEL